MGERPKCLRLVVVLTGQICTYANNVLASGHLPRRAMSAGPSRTYLFDVPDPARGVDVAAEDVEDLVLGFGHGNERAAAKLPLGGVVADGHRVKDCAPHLESARVEVGLETLEVLPGGASGDEIGGLFAPTSWASPGGPGGVGARLTAVPRAAWPGRPACRARRRGTRTCPGAEPRWGAGWDRLWLRPWCGSGGGGGGGATGAKGQRARERRRKTRTGARRRRRSGGAVRGDARRTRPW